MNPIAKSEDELLRLVLRHDGTITGMITHEVAGWLLRLNTHNRSLAKADVNRFTAILERGLWQNTGEPIIISREGVINDGQHRLTAIHETGIAAPCDVRFGIPRSAFVATGTGRRRTAADVLHIDGQMNGKLVAAIAKVIWHYDHGSIGGMNQPVESSEIKALVAATPIIADIASVTLGMKMPVLRNSWFGAALTLIARKSSVEDVREFAVSVDHGQGADTSATRVFHERLVRAAMAKQHDRAIDRVVMAIKAWNAWTVNRPVGLMKVTDGERTSAGFPAIRAIQKQLPGCTPSDAKAA